MTKVVVAAREIKLGTLLTQADLLQVEVPAEGVPPGAISNVEDAVNRYVKADLATGETLMTHKLADPTNVSKDLAFILADDYVMMAFPASDLMSRQNIIKRGDIVDILATLTEEIKVIDETSEKEKITYLYTFDAIQGISITAMVMKVVEDGGSSQTSLPGSNNSEGQEVPLETQSYLLAIDPQDALQLKFLKDAGAVFDIVLRSPSSSSVFDLHPVTIDSTNEQYGLE